MIGASVASRVEEEQTLFRVYRKGIVEAIDTAQTTYPLWMVKINGRWMPFIDETITVGDLVLYDDDFSDPFAWVRTGTNGLWDANLPLKVRGETFFGGWFPSWDQWTGIPPIRSCAGPYAKIDGFGTRRWHKGVVVGADTVELASTSPVSYIKDDIDDTSAWTGSPVPPLPGTPTTYHLDLDGYALHVYPEGIGDVDLPGIHFHRAGADTTLPYSNPQSLSRQWVVLTDAISVIESNVAVAVTAAPSGVEVDFPTVTAPGSDWLLIYFAHIRPKSLITGSPFSVEIGPDGGLGNDGEIGPRFSEGFTTSTTANQQGGIFWVWWRSRSGGDHVPWIKFGDDVDVTLSSFRVHADASLPRV